tara:strand:- start:2 stop:460 length:459 start_codon:yes stop_codon:yes gene_type:complete
MSVATTAGTKLYLAVGKPATIDQAGFEDAALTYVEISETTDLSEIGGEYQAVTYDPIGNRITQTLKGQYSPNSQAISLGMDLTDTGQQMLVTATTVGSATEDTEHSVKHLLKDGTKVYYYGQVMSFSMGFGDANQVTAATTAIAANSINVVV